MTSRGLRNNNPGNIRINNETYQGEVKPSTDTEFKQFKTIAWGYRAMFVILRTYINKYKLNTVEKMINRWAPRDENNTQAYINTVCSRTGLTRNQIIDAYNEIQMKKIVSAISFVENGQAANDKDVQQGWDLYISNQKKNA